MSAHLRKDKNWIINIGSSVNTGIRPKFHLYKHPIAAYDVAIADLPSQISYGRDDEILYKMKDGDYHKNIRRNYYKLKFL